MKDKIIKELKKAGMMEVEICGMPKEIEVEYLYINLGKSETILCSI